MSLLGIGNSLKLLVNGPEVMNHSHISSLRESFSFLSLLMFLLMVSSYARIYLLASVSERIIFGIREKLFEAIFLPSEANASLSASEINVYLGEEAIQLQGILTSTFSTALRSVLMIVGGFVLLFLTSPFLTLLLSGVFVLALSFLYLVSRKFKINAALAQGALNNMRSFIETIFVQFRLMSKPENSFSAVESLFNQRNQLLLERNIGYIKVRALGTAAVTALLFVGLGLIVLCGIEEIAQGRLTSGDLTAFMFYAITISTAFGLLSEMVSSLQRALAILNRFLITISFVPEKAPLKNHAEEAHTLPAGDSKS